MGGTGGGNIVRWQQTGTWHQLDWSDGQNLMMGESREAAVETKNADRASRHVSEFQNF